MRSAGPSRRSRRRKARRGCAGILHFARSRFWPSRGSSTLIRRSSRSMALRKERSWATIPRSPDVRAGAAGWDRAGARPFSHPTASRRADRPARSANRSGGAFGNSRLRTAARNDIRHGDARSCCCGAGRNAVANGPRSLDHSTKQRRRMIERYWLRSLIRVAPGRTLATASGIALAVAFAATLAIFVISASYTMTARAVANVPVDWQVELAPGIDRGAVETALDQAGVAKLVRSVEYAKVDLFTATTGDTQQVTGPGQAIGIAPDYLTAFPGQVTLLSGSLDAPVLYSQTAANLHAGVGDEVSVNRPGLAPVAVRVTGVVAIPNIDSLFQAVGVPPGLAPQSPPDNILILPITTWRSLFDAQRAAKPETIRTQLHVLLDRARLVPGLAAQLGRRIDQHVVDDGRAAHVRDVMLLYGLEDLLHVDLSQADIGPGVRRHRPGKAPAVAMEHRQRPEVDRMRRHAPGDDLRDSV